jgi:hypothetical protein
MGLLVPADKRCQRRLHPRSHHRPQGRAYPFIRATSAQASTSRLRTRAGTSPSLKRLPTAPTPSYLHIRYHNQFAYIEGELTGGDRLPLIRFRYGGSASIWGFGLYLGH